MNTTPPPDTGHRGMVWRLIGFFALAYIANGLGQESGLISQPMINYLKVAYGWDAEQVTNYLTIIILPWIIKPVYGMISDFLPLFGYRRKSWLFLVNCVAIGGYVLLMSASTPGQIKAGLLIASFGIAASTALCGALLVENGKKLSISGKLVNLQWVAFFIATIAAGITGGLLCDIYDAKTALHTAALIIAIAPMGVLVTCFFWVREEKSKINVAGFKASFGSLRQAFSTRTLWLLALFIFFYHFSPSFGNPLYYYEVDTLHFSQKLIGMLSAIGAMGSVLGGLVYAWLLKRVTLKQLMNLSIAFGVVSQASYLMLGWDGGTIINGGVQWLHVVAINLGAVKAGGYWPTGVEAVAIWLAVVNGIMGFVALVSALTLAAEYCPEGAEGFAYAALLSVGNGAQQVSANLGAHMYVHTFGGQLTPLIITSAVITAFAFVLIPPLRLGKKMAGEKDNTDEEKK